MKTNAMRSLDVLGIRYEIREYEVDPDDLAPNGLPATSDCRRSRCSRRWWPEATVMACCWPLCRPMPRWISRRWPGNPTTGRWNWLSLKEVQPLTGYIRGGVTALAGKRNYPVYIDEQIQLFDAVAVSAGVRGTQMLLAPDDYLRATQAAVGPISRESE